MDDMIKGILKESFPILLLCTIGGVIAGMILHDMENELDLMPGIFILLPAILGMRGNISGALGSRLGSALHLGLIEPELKWNKHLNDDVGASIILNVIMSFLLGIIAYIAYVLTGTSGDSGIELMIDLIAISLITGTLAGIFLTALTVLLAVTTYAKGLDPDNVLMPSLSTVGDVITMVCLLIAVKIVI